MSERNLLDKTGAPAVTGDDARIPRGVCAGEQGDALPA